MFFAEASFCRVNHQEKFQKNIGGREGRSYQENPSSSHRLIQYRLKFAVTELLKVDFPEFLSVVFSDFFC
jgi:hypothetical protein